MSYSEALEAAGAVVLEYESFGSYQGEWYAVVEYKGTRGYVCGAYGSCSGCDAFEGEFGYQDTTCDKHNYSNEVANCKECSALEEDYRKRLADFGVGYLEDLFSQEAALSQASANLDWDYDAKQMLKWVEDMGEKYFKPEPEPEVKLESTSNDMKIIAEWVNGKDN